MMKACIEGRAGLVQLEERCVVEGVGRLVSVG